MRFLHPLHCICGCSYEGISLLVVAVEKMLFLCPPPPKKRLEKHMEFYVDYSVPNVFMRDSMMNLVDRVDSINFYSEIA